MVERKKNMEHYWMAYQNDGIEIFDIKRNTRAEAINDLKEAYRADFDEAGGNDPYFDYYITEHFESDTELVYGKTEYFKMSMGKRGGVKAAKIREEH